ncbi:MAG: hypothetical protein M1827_000463 [Pycnora praestabilis]|nr:MAG: hypothetical protein M1827_000463 [Pycnora praestabilis]
MLNDQDDTAPKPIAYIQRIHDEKENRNPLRIPLHPGHDLWIGRDESKCLIIPNDLTVSNRHLRIYSIIYESEDTDGITPLIYAEDQSTNGTRCNGMFIGKGSKSVLLNDGDELKISPSWAFTIEYVRPVSSDVITETEKKERKASRLFEDLYSISERKLGEGACGQVYVATDCNTKQQLACKIINLGKIRALLGCGHDPVAIAPQLEKKGYGKKQVVAVESRRERVHCHKPISEKFKRYTREIEILKSLNHPNIIKLEGVIRTDNTIYLFEDLVTGGDLMSFVESRNGQLGEVDTGIIVLQILKALTYLHDLDIAHRDLKPENVLIATMKGIGRIILTDFGAACKIPGRRARRKRMTSVIGTLPYTAPEVHPFRKANAFGGYTKAIDIWSVGAVTVFLLTGGSFFVDCNDPNYEKDQQEAILRLARKCNLDEMETEPPWDKIGVRTKDFIRRLLVRNPSQRLTAQQALQHCWLTNRHHRDLFERVYQHYIKDWEPRIKAPEIVEVLDLKPSQESLSTTTLTKPAKLSHQTDESTDPDKAHPKETPLLNPQDSPLPSQTNTTAGKKRKSIFSLSDDKVFLDEVAFKFPRSGTALELQKALKIRSRNKVLVGQIPAITTPAGFSEEEISRYFHAEPLPLLSET